MNVARKPWSRAPESEVQRSLFGSSEKTVVEWNKKTSASSRGFDDCLIRVDRSWLGSVPVKRLELLVGGCELIATPGVLGFGDRHRPASREKEIDSGGGGIVEFEIDIDEFGVFLDQIQDFPLDDLVSQ